MTVIRVKGFKIFDDRHGRRRCYHRKTRIAIDLTKAPEGSAEFIAECARISAIVTVTTPKPGTLGMLIEAQIIAPREVNHIFAIDDAGIPHPAINGSKKWCLDT